MKSKLWAILIFTTICLTGKCQKHHLSVGKQVSDTVVKDIPVVKSVPISAYQNKLEIASKLRLDFLEAGFDSIQMRVWYENSSDTGQVIILQFDNGIWKSKFYTYTFHYDKNEKGYSVSILNSLEVSPKSGWSSVIKRLFHLKITSLPDEGKLKNYAPFFHGEGVAIEIATRKLYRFYRYNEPQNAQQHISQAKNVEKISELLESEFNFKRLLCSSVPGSL